MGPYKVVLVDFDGTLVDSLGELYQVYSAFLEHYGKRGTPEEFQELNGPSMPQVIELLAQRYHLNHSYEQLQKRYMSQLSTFYGKQAKPLPGALEWLDQVAAYGLKLCIVTAANRDLVEAFLQHYKIGHYFHEIVTAKEVVRSKPDPALFQLALKKLNTTPLEAVAIEDAPSGVQAAAAAGIFVIRLNPAISEIQPFSNGVDVQDWQAIKRLFNEWYEPVSNT